jgi:hypothetical protein
MERFMARSTSSPIAASLYAEIAAATCAFSLRDRAGPSNDVAHPVCEDRMRQDRRGARSVTHHVVSLLGSLTQHAGTEIFFQILEVDFLRNRDAIVAHDRSAPFLLDHDGLRTWAQRDANRIGKLRYTTQDIFTGCRAKQDLLVSHESLLIAILRTALRTRWV